MTVPLFDLHPAMDDLQTETLQALDHTPKFFPPKLLYDQTGSQLFDQICEQPEYYPTRTEIGILKAHVTELAALIGNGVLVEFGSGSSQKVQILLDNLPDLTAYVALDISKDHLQESCSRVALNYPHLTVVAVCADYSQPIPWPEALTFAHKPKIGFFPGSSIGNFTPDQAIDFLKNAATILQPHGDLLIGVDLKKEVSTLEPAYDDAQGISAQFALNVLTRINRELGGSFDPRQFRYQAPYNPEQGRIEMGLVSQVDQQVQICDQAISLQQGEVIHTEFSHKYSLAEFEQMAAAAGFLTKAVWTDPDQLFSLHYLHLV